MSTEMIKSTAKAPIWFNPRKYPCCVPHPKGQITVPPGMYVIGRCFAQCAQPPHGTSNRSIVHAGDGVEVPRNKILDPLGLLRSKQDKIEEQTAEVARAGLEVYEGRNEEGWQGYFSRASDEQVLADYPNRVKLKKIAQFVGISVKKEATHDDIYKSLKAWADR